MSRRDLITLLTDRWILLGLGILAGFTAVWAIRRVYAIVRSERPDDALSNVGMLVGLGWSSEAAWVLSGPGGADLPTPVRISLFTIFEVILIVFMIRAKRNMRILGHPGRAGRYAWVVAAGMSLVAVWTAHNTGEAFLRLLMPLLLTLQWWDGLIGEGVKRQGGTSSWRWTPRRLLLWLGAIEPGERDIETVHRERLTQQMTQLEFRRRHGSPKQRDRAARRLAKLSLSADDAVIDAVRDRVDRAMWFEAQPAEPAPAATPAGVPAREAASARASRVRHRALRRQVCVTHPRPVIVAAQEPRQDDRATQDVDLVVRAIKAAEPGLSQRRIAILAATSDATVRRALRRTQAAEPSQERPVNGREPELSGVAL